MYIYMYIYTGAVLGFTNLGDINDHLKEYERLLSGEEASMPVANSMLVFMVRGLFSKLQFPYAQFPCSSLAADDIFDPFWEAVSRLEHLGFKVMGLRSCSQLPAILPTYRCLLQSCQPIYRRGSVSLLFSDPPHLLKTVRNAWANPKRTL